MSKNKFGDISGSIVVVGSKIGGDVVYGPASVRRKELQEVLTDVLIITALKEEYDAVLKVDTGARAGSTWKEQSGPSGLVVASRTFDTRSGQPLRVVVGRTLGMGAQDAASVATLFVSEYKPRCLAMCGVCAGRRGAVELGDVIIANRLWTYDSGKLIVKGNETGQRVEHLEGDFLTYNIPPRWVHRAESFKPAPSSEWLTERPRSYEMQGDWLLEQLDKKDSKPNNHPERATRCANWDRVLPWLWEKGLLKQSSLELTASGDAYIKAKRLRYPDGLPDPAPFRVHVGPIGTGSRVVEDNEAFSKLKHVMRTMLGLEMEAAAIGSVARLHDVPMMIVMKGVMDFADSEKNDHFKDFAARASAECLLAFLRENLVDEL